MYNLICWKHGRCCKALSIIWAAKYFSVFHHLWAFCWRSAWSCWRCAWRLVASWPAFASGQPSQPPSARRSADSTRCGSSDSDSTSDPCSCTVVHYDASYASVYVCILTIVGTTAAYNQQITLLWFRWILKSLCIERETLISFVAVTAI